MSTTSLGHPQTKHPGRASTSIGTRATLYDADGVKDVRNRQLFGPGLLHPADYQDHATSHVEQFDTVSGPAQ
jgi:hypothetical protein